jgi:hypothetical protein
LPDNIDVKKAVEIAFLTAKDLIGQVRNLALEEVEFDEKRKQWCITLGYHGQMVKKTLQQATLFGTTTEERERVYKLFRINAHTGEFISMKIRKV